MRDESVPVHRVDGIGQVRVPVRAFGFWTLVLQLHPFFEKDFEVATMQKELAHFGPGLGPGGFAFREPFADLSRTFRGFLVQKMKFQKLNVYARVSFIIYANHAGCHFQ